MRRILTVVLLMMSGLYALDGAARADVGYFDYSTVKQPDNVVELRGAREQYRVPPLLAQACKPLPAAWGEDYPAVVLAQVGLLRMLDTDIGTSSVQRVMNGGDDGKGTTYPPITQDGARTCLTALAPDWETPFADVVFDGKTRRSASGWETVSDELLHMPQLTGRPGTKSGPPCFDGDADLAMAMALRVWVLARYHYPAARAEGLDAAMARVAWLEGGPVPADTVNCNLGPFPVPETENHQLMIESTRYLHNALLPMLTGDVYEAGTNSALTTYVRNDNADNAANGLRARLDAMLSAWIAHDFVEYNSRVYARLQMIGLLNLYDLAPLEDPLRPKVRAVLDLIVAKAATESMGELRNTTFRRRAEYRTDRLFDSDEVSPMMQVWTGDLAPVPHSRINFAEEGTIAASARYRPPELLTDLMINQRHHSYLQGFNGRGQGELAFGAPGLTISGGGWRTPCAYGEVAGICFGSGNDPGHPERLLLMPQRTRMDGDALPVESWMLRGDQSDNACLARGVACSSSWTLGSYAPAATTECRREFSQGADRIRAYRFDPACMKDQGTWPSASCFYAYVRDLGNRRDNPAQSYLVVHTCTPDEGATGFAPFVDYLTTGPGRPGPATSSCGREHGKHPGGTCRGWKFTFRPPPVTGPLTPAAPVTLTAQTTGNGPAAYTASAAPYGTGSAGGDIAQTLDGLRLRFTNPATGESFTDTPTGTAATPGTPRPFTLTGAVTVSTTGPGDALATITGVPYPDLVRDVNVTVIDKTLADECAGTAGCVPFPPISLGHWTYYYRGTPFETGPAKFTDELYARPGDTYRFEACVTWQHLLTSADFWTDPYGVNTPDAHRTCQTTDTTPS
ncbi:hypothetical protein [Actinomadura sp. DC4]|uniref:hypothetical protein n=1 Tax=Actinomadura sp. DC4 TaxID=3055069 RepID=UPI0025AF0322|nr:hypothetical protein [Actinomadura sp. DC4]MDN3354158.1 hypothetical protein [Actinomadura sp. DC4]